MERERSGDDERRDLPRVTEEDRVDGIGTARANEKAGSGWLESGAEDPAFFIKPSDED